MAGSDHEIALATREDIADILDLQDVVKDADGVLTLKTVATIVKDSQDKHHDKCPMKW